MLKCALKGLQVAVKTLIFSSHTKGSQSHLNALKEAALSKSISHTNVVATYYCDLKPVQVGCECSLYSFSTFTTIKMTDKICLHHHDFFAVPVVSIMLSR